MGKIDARARKRPAAEGEKKKSRSAASRKRVGVGGLGTEEEEEQEQRAPLAGDTEPGTMVKVRCGARGCTGGEKTGGETAEGLLSLRSRGVS